MKLEHLKVNPSPEPPEKVKQVSHTYVKNDEVFNIFPHRIVHNDKRFYYVTFADKKKQLTGILIVKEDGTVPLHKDVLEVRQYVSRVEASLDNILSYGHYWAKRPTIVWSKLQFLLKPFAKMVNTTNDEEFKKGYELYCSIPSVIFQVQKELKEVVETAKVHFKELTTDYIITKDFYEKVYDNYLKMMKLREKEYDIQFQTVTVRSQFMEKLKSQIPSYAFIKWIFYWRLSKLHEWLNGDPQTLEMYKNFKNDVSRSKSSEKDRQQLIEMIRNPRN